MMITAFGKFYSCEGQEIFLFFKTPRRLGSPSLLFRGYKRSLAAVELLQHEVTYSPKSSAEVKNELYLVSPLCALMGRTETMLPF
jgi:hypothetical protein